MERCPIVLNPLVGLLMVVAGIYNSWGEHRTDTWRMAMIREVRATVPGSASEDFLIDAPTGEGDFSFIVIGDPGLA